MDEQPDYAGIAARAKRGEYHLDDRRPPIPESVFPKPRGVLGQSFWPFGRDLERYLEIRGIRIPRDAKSVALRYENSALDEYDGPIRTRILVTIKTRRGKKRRYFIAPPVIDNMESSDT